MKKQNIKNLKSFAIVLIGIICVIFIFCKKQKAYASSMLEINTKEAVSGTSIVDSNIENTGSPDIVLQEKKKKIQSMKDENKILIRGKRISQSKVKLSWKDADNDFVYKVYQRVNNGKKRCIATTGKNYFTVPDLSPKKKYKFFIMIYYQWTEKSNDRLEDKIKYMGKSLPLVITTGSQNFMNIKEINVKRKKVLLGKNRSHSIRCRIYLNNSKPVYGKPKLSYLPANTSVARVDSKGKVTALKDGSTVIFVLAPNGVYDKVYVTVKN